MYLFMYLYSNLFVALCETVFVSLIFGFVYVTKELPGGNAR